jgi:hypothetical protein
MQAAVKNILETIWDRITWPLEYFVPRLPTDEQTRLSWAKAVAGPGQVPEAYRSFFLTGPGRADTFDHIILTPTYEGFLNPVREKLICCSARQICILESRRRTLNCTAFAYQDISRVEMGTYLLNAWITLSGLADNGLPATSTFRFNSVTDYLFTPIVGKARPATDPASGADLEAEKAKFDDLIRDNFKFMNYARRTVRPGARVVQFVLQPELRATLLRVFGQTVYRAIAADHILVLTDRELIIIREEERASWERGRPYGGIWTYLKLDKIGSVALTERDDGLLSLSIELPPNGHITSLFSASNKREVEHLVHQIQALSAQLKKPSGS